MQHPRVAIVGAGPAGLTAANILQQNGWRVAIFEADASLALRDQGGTLDLHPDSGQIALHKIGLLDKFLAVARHEDQEERIIDHASGVVVHEDIPEAGTGDRPEIDRVLLREMLLNPLDADVVRWGARVEAVVPRLDGTYDLRLEDEFVGPFDLVIGADGAWSKVRAVLTSVRPIYAGVTFVELWLTDVDRSHPDIAGMVGHGTMFSLHGGAGIIAQRNGEAMIRVYAAFRTRAEDTDRPDKALAGITRSDLLERFEGWAPSLLRLIADADRIAAVRPIVALPPADLHWLPATGLTLVGDAAHVMAPLGVGVNMAMLDAADLASGLVANTDWHAAMRTYEATMLERSSALALEIEQAFADMFGVDGQNSVLDAMGERAHRHPWEKARPG